MHVIPVYRDLVAGGWPRALRMHRPFFAGLEETYGPELFGPKGIPGAVQQGGHQLAARVAAAAGLAAWEEQSAAALALAMAHLPGPPPPVYLACLFDLAPGATVSVAARPAVAIGLERFGAEAPASPPRHLFHPSELIEIIPHEAAHAVRMQGLGLPPTPRQLPLKEMLLLEGTAVLVTDHLLGRPTLGTFMTAADLDRHRTADTLLRTQIRPWLEARGMPVFRQFFSAGSPISGYYLGWSLCTDYLRRTGRTLRELILMPADTVLAAVGLKATGGP